MSYKVFENEPSTDPTQQTVVLVHGFVSSQRYWKRLIPFLKSAGHRVVTIDLLGFGSSRDISASHYTYQTHLAHIETCLRDANVQAPFIIVGHSMGALLSAWYAAKHPPHVRKLILLHPPIYMNATQARHTLYSTGRLYKFLLTSRFRKLGWGLLKVLPAGIENHRGKGREGSLENVIMMEENLHLLAKPPVRTLLVIGEKDRQIYLENLDKMELSENVTVDVIDADHHSPRNKTEMISGKILDFIG
ncbi:MAG: alpha/beta hydrolase [Candidatus Saccharimonadales bacterium]